MDRRDPYRFVIMPPTLHAAEAYTRAVRDGKDEADACRAALAAEQQHTLRQHQENSQYWVDRLAHLEAIKPPQPLVIAAADYGKIEPRLMATRGDTAAPPRKKHRRWRHRNGGGNVK